MTTPAAAATPPQSLERRALSLGTANAIDYVFQFLLPIVLTRALDAESFGRYRLLWLASITLIAIAPFFMPQSLYYFLPRSDRPTQRLYINQTFIFLVLMGLVAGWALSEWNPLRPGSLTMLTSGSPLMVPAFVFFWIVASLLDVLPTVDEQVAWQARAIIGLSTLRTIALAGVAFVTRDFQAVLWTLIALAAFKFVVLVGYVASTHGWRGPWLKPRLMADQVKHAAPFGLAGTLYGLRSQADQWVAAALFPLTMFASFSIAAVLGSMVNLCRQSVNHVFLPSMSRLHSSGDMRAALAMNSRANAMVALLVYPMLAFAFVFADPLISLVYTRTYIDAVPVLRLYAVGLVAFVVELNSVLLLLKQGAFSVRVNACTLAISVALSYWGATHVGLAGAAMGSIAMIYVDRFLLLRRVASLTGEPLASLQDWYPLAAMLAASALAAGLSGFVVNAWHPQPLAMLAAGGLLMAIAYPAALVLTGQRGLVTGLFHALRPSRAQPAPL